MKKKFDFHLNYEEKIQRKKALDTSDSADDPFSEEALKGRYTSADQSGFKKLSEDRVLFRAKYSDEEIEAMWAARKSKPGALMSDREALIHWSLLQIQNERKTKQK